MNELLNDITTDGQNADFAVARSAADDIKVIAQSERAWLRSHPPADCFESSHATALATYEELITTAKAITDAADASDATAIHKQIARAHGDIATLKQAGNKAVTSCA